MKTGITYGNQKPVIMQLQALALFHKQGMAAVEKTFPQYKDFVEAYKNKPFQEVKEQLLHLSHAAA